MATSQSLAQGNGHTPRPVDTALAQILAYVVLVLTSVLSASRDVQAAVHVPVTVVAVVVVLAVFLACSPLRDGVTGKVIAGVCGVASLLFAVVPSAGAVMFPNAASDSDVAGGLGYYPQEVWAAGACGLLIVLVIVSFGRQMAREERSHLIRSLSHGVTGGVAAIAVSGWCFLPDFLDACREAESGVAVGVVWAAVAVIVVLAVLLAVCAYLWERDSNPPGDARRPWIGMGLLPSMFMGPVIAVASLVVTLV